jgi:hypothetical protein
MTTDQNTIASTNIAPIHLVFTCSLLTDHHTYRTLPTENLLQSCAMVGARIAHKAHASQPGSTVVGDQSCTIPA